MSDPAPQNLPIAGFAELMTAVLAKGKPFRFQARGASMSPFIRSGDILTLVPVHRLIRCGEVIAFLRPDTARLTVHRVIGRGRKGFLLKGDNSGRCDGWVATDKIIGRVSRVERRGWRVRTGLGPERCVIAALSRLRLLRPLIFPVRWLLRLVYKRFFA